MSRHYYWLKLNDDFFRDSSVKKLRQIAGGDTYTIIYLKLLLLSLPTDGKLYYDGIDEDFASQVALEIDEDVENVNVTLRFLSARKILLQNTDTEFELSTEPEMVGKETESAKKMRRLRQRQLDAISAPAPNAGHLMDTVKRSHCDRDVTESDESVTQSKSKRLELDIEIEKRESKEKKTADAVPHTDFQGEIDSLYSNMNPMTVEAVKDWIDYKRESHRFTYKGKGLKALLKSVSDAEKTYGSEAVVSLIRTCMASGWKGIIFDRLGKGSGATKSRVANYDYGDSDEPDMPF